MSIIIKELRERTNLSQKRFAEKYGIPVALMEISEEGVLGNYRVNEAEKDHIPLGGQMNEMKFHDWWKDRA